MEIQCPQCASRFSFPDSVAKEGMKLRCSVCNTVFQLQVQGDPQEAQRQIQELLLQKQPQAQAKEEPKPKRKKLLAIAGCVALFLLCLVGALMWHFLGKSGETPKISENELADKVRLLTMRNVRQYIVDNEKVGKVFVIEGKVVNEFPEPKELIAVEGALYGNDRRVIASKQQRCGTQLSLFQLQVLGEKEMESMLNNKIEILTNNINLKHGAEVPFMVLFYAPPDDVSEFGVRIVDVKDVPAGVK